ncbi:formyltransferase family protein [Parerythrobacter aurantius]
MGNAPVVVATLLPELAGRHSDFVDLRPLADAHGIRVAHVRNINDPAALAQISEVAPDFIFVIGWSQICGPELMQLVSGRVIGYHPAPLPRMRGRAVLPWTILNEEKITGATLFWIDDGVDTGDILEQRFFHVAPRENARSLYDRHMLALDSMMRDALSAIAAGNPRKERQCEDYATYAARRRPEDGLIDWSYPACDIDRLVRAISHPYPGAFTHCADGRLIVWKAQPIDSGRHHGVLGQIVYLSSEHIDVITGQGMLRIEEWELSGGAALRQHMVLGAK